MKFLTSGCSFSGWHSWLEPYGETKNLGLAGAGNQYISESVIIEQTINDIEYDCVLVMWSGLQRQDYIVDPLVDINNLPVYNDVRYLPAGDLLVEKTFKEITKKGNECTRAIKSLLEMIKLQNYLQNKKQKYYFMSYVNYWNKEDYLINRNFGIYRYDILAKLASQLDFSRFIFGQDKKCLYEVCLEKQLLGEDNFHPNYQGLEFWMTEYVLPRLKKDKVIEEKMC
jgi:hypothetical protein